MMNKLFCVLLMAMLASLNAGAQHIFSIEEISKEEYIKAERTSADYNIYPQRIDSIAKSVVINKIFQDVRERLPQLDTLRYLIDIPDDAELYCIKKLTYVPEWNMIGMKIPDYFDDIVWWYDSNNGEFKVETCYTLVSINSNGNFVCQKLSDCDTPLDLHFFKKEDNLMSETNAYKDKQYNGELILYELEDENYKPIFWHKNNTLYLRTNSIAEEKCYLKISQNKQ